MYSTIKQAITNALRGDAGLDRSTIDGYEHEISIVASHLTNRLDQALQVLKAEAITTGYDPELVDKAFEDAGLKERVAVAAPSRPFPAVSGGVVPQPGAVSSKAQPRLPDPRREAPKRTLLQRLFGG